MTNIVSKDAIRDFYGRILGFVETDREGNQQVRAFSGIILGFYDKKNNCTRDFYGKIISKGNTAVGLLYKDQK